MSSAALHGYFLFPSSDFLSLQGRVFLALKMICFWQPEHLRVSRLKAELGQVVHGYAELQKVWT